MTTDPTNHSLRLYWIFPILVVAYAALGTPNTQGFVFPIFLCALAIGLVLWSIGHDVRSFVAIVALVHALFYPLAALLNLMLEHHALFDDAYWPPTPLAMKACALAMVGFACGAAIGNIVPVQSRSRSTAAIREVLVLPPAWKNLALCSLIFPLALFKIRTNTYYHILASGAEGWSESNALAFGYVGYLEYIVYAGIFLQMRRMFFTRSKKDVLFAFLCVLLPIFVMLPSGSRDATLVGPTVAVGIATLAYGRIMQFRSLVVLGSMVAIALFLMIVIAIYRVRVDRAGGVQGISERISYLKRELRDRGQSDGVLEGKQYLAFFAARFADYIAVGKIVDEFPEKRPFRGLEDVQYWPAYVLPNQVRPPTPGFDPRDGATLCDRIGMVVPGGGSSPAMIVGDLYSRFGWLGLFFGMIPLGYALRQLDAALRCMSLWGIVLFAMLLPTVRLLPIETVFTWFQFFTRALLIVATLAWLVTFFLRKNLSWSLVRRQRDRHPRVARQMPNCS